MNRICLIGRVSKIPVTGMTMSGVPAINLEIETKDKWIDKDGTTKEKVSFIKAIQWGKMAETTERFIGLNDIVGIEGSLSVRTSIGEGGRKEYAHEVKIQTIEKLNRDKE